MKTTSDHFTIITKAELLRAAGLRASGRKSQMDVNRERMWEAYEKQTQNAGKGWQNNGMTSYKSQIKKPMEVLELKKSGCQILLCLCFQTSRHS